MMKSNRGRKAYDLTGRRFGRLVVIERSDWPETSSAAYWRARCDCGNEVVVRSTSLLAGTTKSCGCLRSEVARELVRRIPRRGGGSKS